MKKNKSTSTKKDHLVFGIFINDEIFPRYISQTSNIDDQRRFHMARIRYMEALYDLKIIDVPVEFRVLEKGIIPSRVNERKTYWTEHFESLGPSPSNRRPVSGGQIMNRGACNGNAKLKAWQVRAIRASEETARELAQRFAVSVSTIHRVVQRITWRGIA